MYFDKLYKKSNRSFYLAVFRLFIVFHYLKKILFEWPYLSTLYGTNSFVVEQDPILNSLLNLAFLHNNYEFIIWGFMVTLIFYGFGVGKHFTALLVFLFIEILQRMNGYILNGGDNILKFMALYMVFCNSYQYFSMYKLNFVKPFYQKISNLFTNLGVISIISHLSIIYFISGINKLHSDVWFNGVAVYYTMSLERFMGTSFNPMLVKNGYLVTLATYFTLFWELSFIFVVWNKKVRPYFLLLGVFMHLGIYTFMMIYGFQIIYIMLYGFFFTNNQWFYFLRKIDSRILKGLSFKITPKLINN
jgi:hypothetical protein